MSGQQHAQAALYPGKDPVPILQEAGWAPGPVWTGGKSRPHRDSIPERPACRQSLYRLSYQAHTYIYTHTHTHTHSEEYRDAGRAQKKTWAIVNTRGKVILPSVILGTRAIGSVAPPYTYHFEIPSTFLGGKITLHVIAPVFRHQAAKKYWEVEVRL